MDGTQANFSSQTNSSHDSCGTLGEVYTLQGTNTVESKLRYVNFSYELAVILAVVNTILPVIALLGNTLVIATMMAFRELRIPANLYLLSLASTDLLAGALSGPGFAYSLVLALLPNHQRCMVDGRVVMELLGGINITSSLGSLCLVTVDRYIAIQFPLRYHSVVTKTRASVAIAVMWALGLVLALGVRLMAPNSMNVEFQALWWMYVISACAIMVSIHFKLWRISRRHQRKICSEASRFNNRDINIRDRRAVNTVVVVSLSLLICYLPFVVLGIENRLNSGNQSPDRILARDISIRVALTLLLLNSSLNPTIYFMRSQKLRRYARKLFSSLRSVLDWDRFITTERKLDF